MPWDTSSERAYSTLPDFACKTSVNWSAFIGLKDLSNWKIKAAYSSENIDSIPLIDNVMVPSSVTHSSYLEAYYGLALSSV